MEDRHPPTISLQSPMHSPTEPRNSAAAAASRSLLRRFVKTASALATTALLSTAAFASQPVVSYIGGSLAWTTYGATFDNGVYNATTMGNYLSTWHSYHLNYMRVWACEGLDGLTFDGSGNCTGIKSSNLANIVNFAQQANALGITVEYVFINYQDVNSSRIVTHGSSLINNALVPLGKALQPYQTRIDIINEGNLDVVGGISWSQMRSFLSSAVTALRNAGVDRWLTMSDQNYVDYQAANFPNRLQGLGFDYYEYHSYNDDGSLAVNASQVDAPLFLGEYGPDPGWLNFTYAQNQTFLNATEANALSKGYSGASFWAYITTDNYELIGKTILSTDIANWAASQSCYEAEDLDVHASSGQSFTLNSDLGYSNGHGMIFNATGVGNNVTLIVPNIAAGSYDVRIGVKKYTSRGIVQLAIGSPTFTPTNFGSPQDLYSGSATFTEIDLGTWSPGSTSDKYFQFTVTGKNAASTGYSMALDYIRVIPQ